jgi:rhodanese-related sulfurtransferase
MRAEIPPLVVDIRAHIDRLRLGMIAGSIHVPRTVLEWQFDPANGYLHAAAGDFGRPLVLVCNGGYSSSMAAANLALIGYERVADLVGGFSAWHAAGLHVAHADHVHVEPLSAPRQH